MERNLTSRVFRSLFLPILYFGVPGVALVIEGLTAIFLGLIISWYFIAVAVVIHIALVILFRKNPFLLKILILSVLTINIRSDFMEGENEIQS